MYNQIKLLNTVPRNHQHLVYNHLDLLFRNFIAILIWKLQVFTKQFALQDGKNAMSAVMRVQLPK